MNRKTPASARRRSTNRRLPYWEIGILFLFALCLLYFLTFRQYRLAERDRVRLLDGFASRVEATVESLAELFAGPARSGQDPKKYLEHVRTLFPLDDEAPGAADPRSYPILLRPTQGRVYLSYRRPDDKPDSKRDAPRRYSRFVELEEEFPADQIPRPFDAVFLADGSGDVFYSLGQPELRATNLASLMAGTQSLPDVLVKALERALPTPSEAGAESGDAVNTDIHDAVIGGVVYRAFFQPITIRLPQLPSRLTPEPQHWIVCGLVQRDRLLASSYTSSPTLLLGLLSVLPAALVLWPFIKLVFISNRQRFTKLNVVALASSTILGLSVATHITFSYDYLTERLRQVDRELRGESSRIESDLRSAIEAVWENLEEYENDPAAEIADGIYHALFTVNEAGCQVHKRYREFGTSGVEPVDLRDKPENDNLNDCARVVGDSIPLLDVHDRPYFRCVQDPNRDGCLHRRFEIAGQEVAAQAVLSRFSGQSELIVARKRQDGTVIAVSTQMAELSNADERDEDTEVGFALLGRDGHVQIHSQRERNVLENFFKATDNNNDLAALVKNEQPGWLRINYWGEPHRMFLRPIAGTPWTLVTFRDLRDLRQSVFLTTHQYLNLFLLGFTANCILGGIVLIAVGARRRSELLGNWWPREEFRAVYLATTIIPVLVVVVFCLLLASESSGAIVLASTAIPLLSVFAFLYAILPHRAELDRDRTTDADGQRLDGQSGMNALRLWLDQQAGRYWDIASLALVLALLTLLILFLAGPGSWIFRLSFGAALAPALLLSLFAVLYRHRFQPGQRRLAFRLALSALLFVAAVLPTIGIEFLVLHRSMDRMEAQGSRDLALPTQSPDRVSDGAANDGPRARRSRSFLDAVLDARAVSLNDIVERPSALDIERFAFEQGGGRRLVLWWTGFAGLVLLPVGLGWFLSEKLFLASLAQSGQNSVGGHGTLQGVVEGAMVRVDKDKNGEEEERRLILLLTRIPRLAVEYLKAEHSSQILEFRDIASGNYSPPAESAGARTPVIVAGFFPRTADDARAHQEVKQFEEFLKSYRSQSIIILSQRDPRGLMSGALGSGLDNRIKQEWEGLLARFTFQQARDAGDPADEYRATIEEAIQERPGVSPGQHVQDLTDAICAECGYTRRLQQIGLRLARQLNPLHFTTEELTSQVALLARSYYRSIWEGCNKDEKVVLIRLAEDGFTSPENFDHLVELLQKGLVRRDPALRVMNESFGQFASRSVNQAELQLWEDEAGLSAWTIAKWLLPLPILLLGGFLFQTQREAFSNVMGLTVFIGSVAPILLNFYDMFREQANRSAALRQEPRAFQVSTAVKSGGGGNASGV